MTFAALVGEAYDVPDFISGIYGTRYPFLSTVKCLNEEYKGILKSKLP